MQVYHGAGQPWDSHSNLLDSHRRLASESDGPLAALLADLFNADALKDTLVIWGEWAGRRRSNCPLSKPGRDHHNDGFTIWMAGGA
ncbi:MAG: DUF1501 domain-containing protein [Pirellulaceae bacterium]